MAGVIKSGSERRRKILFNRDSFAVAGRKYVQFRGVDFERISIPRAIHAA